MTSLGDLAGLGESALLLALLVSLPVVGVAAVVGLVVAAFQAATQLQDPTIAHLPRLVAVALALVVIGPWMGSEIADFALEALAPR
ncbi:MAG TPA: type III secretion system export apparatus subunit SctS [Polyangiaceae bacterium]|nr:type III secretion system export apparatus subunit SctS [Polyangiaceae bacterium]